MTSNDRSDTFARALHAAFYTIPWDSDIPAVHALMRTRAHAILATDDPAAVAALAATLAERHPEAVLTAGVEAGVLLDVGTSEDTQYMSGLRPREVTS